jgi:hypothetical protein
MPHVRRHRIVAKLPSAPRLNLGAAEAARRAEEAGDGRADAFTCRPWMQMVRT